MHMINKIFLIDDDPITNFINKDIITELQLVQKMEIFTEAEAALDDLRNISSEDPNLILLDLNMPGLNGFDFIEALQDLPAARVSHIKIVVLTSSKHSRDMKRLKQLGVVNILNKPLTKEKILSVI